MGELGEEHRREVTYHAEGAGFGIHAGLQGETVDHSARNEVENLLEDDHIGPDWWCLVHYPLPCGRDFNSTPAHFFARSYAFLWDGCESYRLYRDLMQEMKLCEGQLILRGPPSALLEVYGPRVSF